MSNPYETPDADLHAGSGIEPNYVGFWARVVASIVDSVVMMALVFALASVVMGLDEFVNENAEFTLSSFLIQIVLPIAFVLLFWIYRNATPGKMLVGAVIVDAKTGKSPSAGQYIIRYIGYYVSTIILMLGFFWVAFDKRKQGWHDKMAGTVVIKGRAPASND